MTSNDLAYALVTMLDEYDALEDADCNSVGVEHVSTFDDAGLLTSNDGVVLRLADGSIFQLSIVDATPATF